MRVVWPGLARPGLVWSGLGGALGPLPVSLVAAGGCAAQGRQRALLRCCASVLIYGFATITMCLQGAEQKAPHVSPVSQVHLICLLNLQNMLDVVAVPHNAAMPAYVRPGNGLG